MPDEFFNEQEALSRVDGDTQFLKELLRDFESYLKLTLSEMKKAQDNEDFKSLYELAHGVKGAAGNLALNQIVDVSYGIELESKNEESEKIGDMILKLKSCINKLTEIL